MPHSSASIGFRDGGPEITSHTRKDTYDKSIDHHYIDITWKSEDENSDLTIFLDLYEAVTFIQDLSAVVFAQRAANLWKTTAKSHLKTMTLLLRPLRRGRVGRSAVTPNSASDAAISAELPAAFLSHATACPSGRCRASSRVAAKIRENSDKPLRRRGCGFAPQAGDHRAASCVPPSSRTSRRAGRNKSVSERNSGLIARTVIRRNRRND